MTITLPPEITDLIIDHVYSGGISQLRVHTITSCSLVSKTWLPRCRVHLFRWIALDGRHTLDNSRDFTRLICHPLCTFISQVKRLSISDGGRRIQWAITALPILSVLRNVERLDLNGMSFLDISEKRWHSKVLTFFRALSNVKRLSMSFVSFKDSAQTFETLECFRDVERISLYQVTPLSCPGIVPEARAVFPPIKRSVEITYALNHPIAGFCSWAATSGIRISVLQLESVKPCDVDALAHLLSTLGDCLEVLDIGASVGCQDALCRAVDLAQNSGLRQIRFSDVGLLKKNAERNISAKQIPILLEQITSDSIQTINIQVNLDEVDDLDLIAWDAIVSVLNRPNYRGLETLQVWTDSDKKLVEELDDLLKRRLRGLRDGVSVSCVYGWW